MVGVCLLSIFLGVHPQLFPGTDVYIRLPKLVGISQIVPISSLLNVLQGTNLEGIEV